MATIYIVADVEAAGRHPGRYSMLSLGACIAFERTKTFYLEIKPRNKNYDPESMKVNGLSLQRLGKHGKTPREAMLSFEKWIYRVSDDHEPWFVAFPAWFDWGFVSEYFERFLGRNPFGERVLDMKAYFAGKMNLSPEEATREKLFELFPAQGRHSHNALDDALGYAESFEQLIRTGRGHGRVRAHSQKENKNKGISTKLRQ